MPRSVPRCSLQSYEPGSLICDEHEEADCLYVIGNGIIKVVTGVSWLFPPSTSFDSAALAPLEKVSGPFSEDIVAALNRLIVDPVWHDTPAVRAAVTMEKLMARVWGMMAGNEHRSVSRDGALQSPGAAIARFAGLSALKGDALAADADPVFALADFGTDWKKLSGRLVADDKKADDPAHAVWDRLPPPVQDHLRQSRTAEIALADREAVVATLNNILRGQLLLLTPACSAAAQTNAKLAEQLLSMLAEGQLWCDFDFHRWNRCLNRLVMETLCPIGLAGLPKPSGLPNILAYRSRNEILGEIGLLECKPRTATLVTYNHPKNDPKREVGPVQLYRIGKAVVDEMLLRRPELSKRLKALAEERHRADRLRA